MEHSDESFRVSGNDTGKDDQRDSITNTMLCDLFSQPHNNHGTGDQGNHSREMEEKTCIGNHTGKVGKPKGDGDGVESRQSDCPVTSDLIELLLTVGSLFTQLLKVRNDTSQKLNNDGRRDIGHDTQGKDGSALKIATHKEIQQAINGSLSTLRASKEGFECGSVHAGHRHETTKTVKHQEQCREENLLFQVRNPEHVSNGLKQTRLPPPCRRSSQ